MNVTLPRAHFTEVVTTAAKSLNDEEARLVTETAASIDRVAHSNYTNNAAECGCPLVEAGVIDGFGLPTGSGTRQQHTDFIEYFDGEIAEIVARQGGGLFSGAGVVEIED